MNKTTCLIYNNVQHYRGGIFKALDQELKIESYRGIKKLDDKELDYFQKELINISLILNKDFL
ncbi:MAG: hypothetical protein ABJH82_04135 [Polaribacter sp.]|uniref:hypothetical protein n=1 Tax=Polaribacter sp. TaxID=1920175 RepID=UPI0032657A1A